jgi:hypothetical protein
VLVFFLNTVLVLLFVVFIFKFFLNDKYIIYKKIEKV